MEGQREEGRFKIADSGFQGRRGRRGTAPTAGGTWVPPRLWNLSSGICRSPSSLCPSSPVRPSVVRQWVNPPVDAPAEVQVLGQGLERVPVGRGEEAAGDRAERVEPPLSP